MNPAQIKQAMKKLGIKQEEIEAKQVIIKCANKNIIITNPEIIKMNMMGKDSLQITGDIHEEQNEEITEEDILTVVEQTNVSKEKAKETIKKCNGNLAEAIIKLQNN